VASLAVGAASYFCFFLDEKIFFARGGLAVLDGSRGMRVLSTGAWSTGAWRLSIGLERLETKQRLETEH
jgi:hypothetical protein